MNRFLAFVRRVQALRARNPFYSRVAESVVSAATERIADRVSGVDAPAPRAEIVRVLAHRGAPAGLIDSGSPHRMAEKFRGIVRRDELPGVVFRVDGVERDWHPRGLRESR